MSKALVIKGANFLANAVEQISISEPVPCTGISLSQNTLSFSHIGDTAMLTATLTPADTTEAVTWVSSNPDVATVSNGVITSVGVGQATITVACGTQSAVCAVTCTHIISLNTAYSHINGKNYSGSMQESPLKNHVGLTDNANARAYYSSVDILGGYRAYYDEGDKYAMPIPTGATSALVNVEGGLTSYNNIYIILVNTNQKCIINGREYNYATGIFPVMQVNNPTSHTVNIEDYENANGFVLTQYLGSSVTPEGFTGDITVTFS